MTDHRERVSDTTYQKSALTPPLSDPETPLIAHTLKERDKTEEEFRKRKRTIREGESD